MAVFFLTDCVVSSEAAQVTTLEEKGETIYSSLRLFGAVVILVISMAMVLYCASSPVTAGGACQATHACGIETCGVIECGVHVHGIDAYGVDALANQVCGPDARGCDARGTVHLVIRFDHMSRPKASRSVRDMGGSRRCRGGVLLYAAPCPYMT